MIEDYEKLMIEKLNKSINKEIEDLVTSSLFNNKNNNKENTSNYYTISKEKFLKTKVKNCPTCGNKIKPTIVLEQDMNATLDCPEIACYYCGTSAGLFWPGEYEKCLNSWNNTIKDESFVD